MSRRLCQRSASSYLLRVLCGFGIGPLAVQASKRKAFGGTGGIRTHTVQIKSLLCLAVDTTIP